METSPLVIGLDFGTDSVRAVLTDASNGKELAQSVFHFPRWKSGRYCNPARQQYRQHPLDHIEGLEYCIREILKAAGPADQVKSIAVGATGSTPAPVDQSGRPLALLKEFAENPHAMFILWKDHTAIQEAEEINGLCRSWQEDYSRYSGGIYSSEWFWSKILHTLRADQQVRKAAYSWLEHCDWVPHLLTGGDAVQNIKRSRCAAGHKAMWHEEFGGLPSEEFLTTLDPLLKGLRDRLYQNTYTSDVAAGNLSAEWAERLGLHTGVQVSVGALDAHMGAVGAQISPYFLCKVMGTSTCDMTVAPPHQMKGKLVNGICGQVDGSIVPGMIGLEAGQSAFGDLFAWFKKLLTWIPVDESKTKALAQEGQEILEKLNQAAEQVPAGANGLLILDWLNGRRTPDANQSLRGVIAGLHLGSDAPTIFRALVEAACFGARSIVERFQEEGIPIKGIIALGGVAKKSPFVMQVLADVLNRPIKITGSDQPVALGAAMYAATTAGIYPDLATAIQKMGKGFSDTYSPKAKAVKCYHQHYKNYKKLGELMEQFYGHQG